MPGHDHHEFHEEAALGSIYDARLIKRLLIYLKPYRVHLSVSLLVLLAVTGFELALPHLTKEAIDRHIIVSGCKAVLDRPVPGTFKLSGDTVLVDVSRLFSDDKYSMACWQKQGLAGNTSYYYFELKNFPQPEPVLSIVSSRPGIFSRYGDVVLIRHSDLKSLSAGEISTLRARDFAGIKRIGLLFLGLIVLGFALNFFQTFLVLLVGQRFMHDLRRKVFARLQLLDMRYFDRNPVGRLVTRAANDVDAVNEAFTSVFLALLRDMLLTLAILGMLFFYSLKLALVVMALLPFIALWTVFFRIRARDIYRRIRIRLARLNATLQENISGVRVIQIFRRQAESVRRFKLVNRDYFQASMQEVLVMSFFRPLVEVISGIGLGLIIYYGGGQVIRQNISLGALVAFITYLRMFFRPIQELTESYTVLQSAMASSERIFQLLDEPVTIKDIPREPEPERAAGRIEFRNVCFEYLPGEPVLKDISFTVAPGEKVALVGSTGSGKTTIINLLSRLYDVTGGQILLDGTDIRELGLSSLRSSLGVVMQDVFLFSGDIKGNIRLNKKLSDEKVKEIARQVHADTFIERLPGKYDHEVRERGVTLSAGERQLLSFARALACDPPVLTLDEATANIDSATEKLIQDALDILMRGRTSIAIAHRLSTIKHVDRIYVLHKGQIKEVGAHQELLKKRGIYYNLYQLQHGKETE
ncbi:ABC transporter ATP-binding protein [candidate division TA06 bacterium]|uniref:ABC transporter ATP-binding protein n=1 Tax=candidate division TA06 bacterium TaxID=2250710 RepID=A0A933IBP0_UNCT6|nr:ABC transporter ATP-binding protein [candidate division TA06 bacterium]